MANDRISFYDESLRKQIEGTYVTDGKSVHVRSVKYGIKSAPYGHHGTFVDKNSQDVLAQMLLRELARDAANGHEKPSSEKPSVERPSLEKPRVGKKQMV